jgi:hypothetical protein
MLLCDSKLQECPLLTHIHTRKLVLRNLDSRGLPLRITPYQGERRRRIWEELVVVLPTASRRLERDGRDERSSTTRLLRLGEAGALRSPNCPAVTVVFYPVWEGDYIDSTWTFTSFVNLGVDPVTIVCALFSLTAPERGCAVYGMERLVFHEWAGDILSQYRYFFNFNEDPSQGEIRDIVRNEIRTGSLGNGYGVEADEFVFDTGEPELLTYGTLKDYLDDTDSRHAEINDLDWARSRRTRQHPLQPQAMVDVHNELVAEEEAPPYDSSVHRFPPPSMWSTEALFTEQDRLLGLPIEGLRSKWDWEKLRMIPQEIKRRFLLLQAEQARS